MWRQGKPERMHGERDGVAPTADQHELDGTVFTAMWMPHS